MKRSPLCQEIERMRAEMKPAEAISEQRLAALQARLEALHAAKLLGDDELYALEDMVADFVEFEGLMGSVVVTFEALNANENASKLMQLAVLSERFAADGGRSRGRRGASTCDDFECKGFGSAFSALARPCPSTSCRPLEGSRPRADLSVSAAAALRSAQAEGRFDRRMVGRSPASDEKVPGTFSSEARLRPSQPHMCVQIF